MQQMQQNQKSLDVSDDFDRTCVLALHALLHDRIAPLDKAGGEGEAPAKPNAAKEFVSAGASPS
jgi:hypothetical protein